MRTLVIDLDAQANASMCIAGDDILDSLIDQEKTMEHFLTRGVLHNAPVKLSDYVRMQATSLCAGSKVIPLSLVAASPELRYAEREMIYSLTKLGFSLEAIEGRVSELVFREVSLLRNLFDIIIFDCPPGISAFTEAVLKSSDLIVTPVVPDKLSMYGLMAFCNRVLASPKASQVKPRLPWVLANRVTPTKVARERIEEMRKEAAQEDRGFHMFEFLFPQSAPLVSAVDYEDPAPTYAKKYGAARPLLEKFAEETLEILNENR
jgi:cellulose biosynthesis protein BcsQ